MATPKFKVKVTTTPENTNLNTVLGISEERSEEIVNIIDAVELLSRDDEGATDKLSLLNGVLAKAKDFQEATFITLVLGGYFADCDRKRAMEEQMGGLISKLKASLEGNKP